MYTEINPKFRTKAGKLTRYAFCCGYIEQKEINTDNRGTIALEPNGYHVKGFRNGIHFWEIFLKVNDARKYLNTMLKTDSRYTISHEFTGHIEKRFTLRFLGNFIGSYVSMETANDALIAHNKARFE